MKPGLAAARGLMGAVLLAVAGCRDAPAPRPALVSVGIIVVPAGLGSAEFLVHRDSTMRGAHLSGDSVPFVHQDEGRLDSLVVDSLWNLAGALDSSIATRSPPTGRGYAALATQLRDGRILAGVVAGQRPARRCAIARSRDRRDRAA